MSFQKLVIFPTRFRTQVKDICHDFDMLNMFENTLCHFIPKTRPGKIGYNETRVFVFAVSKNYSAELGGDAGESPVTDFGVCIGEFGRGGLIFRCWGDP